MVENEQTQRRTYDRLAARLPVQYKFISVEGRPIGEEFYHGETRDISSSGLLLVGPIPDQISLRQLLKEKITIWMLIEIGEEQPSVQALARVAWLQSDKESAENCVLGLEFTQITTANVDKIYAMMVRGES